MYNELIRKVGIQNILTQKGVIFIVRIEQFQWFQRLRGKNYHRQWIERKDIKVKKTDHHNLIERYEIRYNGLLRSPTHQFFVKFTYI